jgi:hypothetical protein
MWFPASSVSLGNREQVGENTGTGLRIPRNLLQCRSLTKAIWIANGGSCEVEVNATYLEELPHEDYLFGESDYEGIMGQSAGADGDG